MSQHLRRQISKVRALRLDTPSLAQGGLAFMLAYVLAYFFSAI
jgi:hypothetical protein